MKKQSQDSSMTITEAALKELFDRCGGRRSHYLILNAEPPEYIDLLQKEGWIVPLKNGMKRPWYTASQQLIEKFRELAEHEKAQLKAQAADEVEEQKEIERANIEKAKRGETKLKKDSFAEPVKDDMPDIAVGTVYGPNHAVYPNVAAAATATGNHPNTIRKWCKDPENKLWTRYE